MLVKQTDSSISDSFDCISVFLCIHLVQRYQLLCHKRCVGGLDRYMGRVLVDMLMITVIRYWENLNSVLWPRLTNVMQMNIVSVREFDTSRRKPADVRPHYSTRRSGWLLSWSCWSGSWWS